MKRLSLLLIVGLGSLYAATAVWAQQDQAHESRLIPDLDAELFSVDTAHSNLFFSIGFLGFNEVQGTFGAWHGTLLYKEGDLSKLSITLSLEVPSIDTDVSMRDKDLQSERFFDADTYPRIVFQSTAVEKTADGAVVHGVLTMRGVAREIAVPITQTVQRQADAAWGNIYVGFEGNVTINRRDFDIDGGSFWGVKALSEDVDIGFSLLANRPNMSRRGQGEDAEAVAAIVAETQTKGSAAGLRAYEAHIAQKPLPPFYTRLIGQRLVQAGYVAEAVPFFERAIAVSPEHVGTYLDLAEAHALLGNQAAALTTYTQAQERAPDHTTVLEMLRHLR